MEPHVKEALLKRLSTASFSRPLYRQITKAIDTANTPRDVVPILLRLTKDESDLDATAELELATDILDLIIDGNYPFDAWASLSFESQMDGTRESVEFFGRLERYTKEVHELKEWLKVHEHIGNFDNAEIISLVHQARTHYDDSRFDDADASLHAAAEEAWCSVDSFRRMSAPDWSDYADLFDETVHL